MAQIVKNNFSGGLNQAWDETRVDLSTQQTLAVNVRTRRGVVEPVKLPLDITQSLVDVIGTNGKIQGIYAYGDYVIVFVNGLMYYSPQAQIGWVQITGVQMSATAEQIYLAFVPASMVNFVRKNIDDADIRAGVTLQNTLTTETPRCAVVMDGISQPVLVEPNLNTRLIQSYSQWTIDNPEYVPIASKPFYHPDGILYCVGKDYAGRESVIYRSVSGQPLNFVVAITKNGDKISSVEIEGGAYCMSHQVDADNITCMQLIGVPDSGFLVTTARNSYLVFPDYANLIYGEPQFRHQFLFSVGSLNQNSIVDIGGDTALIHFRGVRSFNGTAQVRFAGKNDPFSLLITDLLDGITQTVVAAASFDNYAVFALTTKYGPGLVWFDTLTKSWSSVDLYYLISLAKQFAVIQSSRALELFFYTTENKLYKAFASDVSAPAVLYLGAYLPPPGSEHCVHDITAKFSGCTKTGYVQCSVYHDRIKSPPQVQLLPERIVSKFVYTPVPFAASLQDDTEDLTFNFRDTSEYGYKIGTTLEWSATAKLLQIEITTEEKPVVTDPRSPQILVPYKPDRLVFVGDDGLDTPLRAGIFDALMREPADLYIGVGDHLYRDITPNPEDAFYKYWRTQLTNGRFIAVPGNHDQDKDNCRAFREFMRMQPTSYFRHVMGSTSIYMMNDGFQTNGTQIEPDNEVILPAGKSTQFTWLRAQLEDDPRSNRIVVWHQPPYTSGQNHYPGNIYMRGVLLRSLGASALVCGHTHALERLYADDITVFVTGGGGARLYAQAAQPLPETQFYRMSYGYLTVSCWPMTMEFEFKVLSDAQLANYNEAKVALYSQPKVVDQWIVRR